MTNSKIPKIQNTNSVSVQDLVNQIDKFYYYYEMQDAYGLDAKWSPIEQSIKASLERCTAQQLSDIVAGITKKMEYVLRYFKILKDVKPTRPKS